MLDTVLPEMDIIVLTIPLTKETYYLINNSRLEKLKEGAVLVNVARGAVVDIVALENNLDHLGEQYWMFLKKNHCLKKINCGIEKM